MDITIFPHHLSGSVRAIPSKSQAHRLLICAAFADRPTQLICPESNRDIDATVRCLQALGARIQRTPDGFYVIPGTAVPPQAELFCGESGSTLRFLLPIAGALGVRAVFHLEGRLPFRPLSPLWEVMESMGCTLTRPGTDTVLCTGQLKSGAYSISGSVSSQYITGLLFALTMLPGDSTLSVTGKLESAPYIRLTRRVMGLFGAEPGGVFRGRKFPFHSPGNITAEGDWSNAAFFLTANTLGSQVTVSGLSEDSAQGDREIMHLLPRLEQFTVIDAADIPDLVPVLAVAAAAKQGAVFSHIGRLRLKESDRVESVIRMLGSLGIRAEADSDTLRVFPGRFQGGTVDAAGDHRIAMAAAVAATAAAGPVTVLGAQCVKKSYPSFWEVYRQTGGHYEQYIR